MNIKILPSTDSNNILHDTYQESIVLSADREKELYIGDPDNKVCRFCKKDSSSTTFNQVAHLMPDFMGNNRLFSFFECDSCNALFSRYESDFARFFGIHHTMTQISGKKGIPKFRETDGDFEIEPDKNVLNIKAKDINRVKIDLKSETLSLSTIRQPYIPRNVFKCLVKIAFCLIRRDDLHNYEVLRKWLLSKDDGSQYPSHPFFKIYYNIGGGLYTKFPLVVLFRRDEGKSVPYNTVIVSYSHLKFQIFLPFHPSDNFLWQADQVGLPIMEQIVNPNKDHLYCKDCSSNEKVIGEVNNFTTGFTGGKKFQT